jgi:hypothetical protein
MAQLLDSVFRPAFANPMLTRQQDGAAFELCLHDRLLCGQAAVFFGGDTGKLAVCGTVNDLSMCGARPLHLSAGFILEEGLEGRARPRDFASGRRLNATAEVGHKAIEIEAKFAIAYSNRGIAYRGQGRGRTGEC